MNDVVTKNSYAAYKLIDCYVPNSHCNLRCEYCYAMQDGDRDSARPKFRRTPQEIGRAFNPARWDADYLFVNFCGPGETFLCKEIPDIVAYVLLQGNIVLITNNGTITPAIEKLLNLPDDLTSRLMFGVSLHYKELKKRNLLNVFTENVKKIAASPASFHVSFNLYDGYFDCLDEIKNYCVENFGAPPQVAVTRDQVDGMKLYGSADMETYKKIGAQFNSPRFDIECDNFLVNRRKYFCHAGETSWFLDLATGDLKQCYCERAYFNAYDDLEQKIPLSPVGRHCKAVYCINASYFISCGNIPEINLPSYTELRDRPEAGWHKQIIKNALDKKMLIKERKKPSVLLLGDSISLGYREFVKADLEGVMNVYYPPENGRFAAYTFRALYEWTRDYDFPKDMDFVYWNNGLWDTARIFGDEPQTSLQDYEIMISRVYQRLKYLFPNARIIFATTTPVIEDLFDKKVSYRLNEDIKKYNEAATQVVLKNGGIVHDLYGNGIDTYPRQVYQDAVHFLPQASQFIARNISAVLKGLSLKTNA